MHAIEARAILWQITVCVGPGYHSESNNSPTIGKRSARSIKVPRIGQSVDDMISTSMKA